MSALDVAAVGLMLVGVAFVFLAALGPLRFDDVFSRIHATTKAITLGLLLVVAAATLSVETPADVLKLGLAALLQLISCPVSGHMLGRAAYGDPREKSTNFVIDHLARKSGPTCSRALHRATPERV